MKNTNFVVSHNNEDMSLDEAVLAYNDLMEGFVCSVPDVLFKFDEFIKIMKDIRKIHPDLEEYDYSKNKNNFYKKYIGEDILIYVRGNSVDLYGSFYTKNEKDNNDIFKIYNKHSIKTSDVQMFMHSFSLISGILDESVKTISAEELDYINEMYYPYIDVNIMFDQFFTGSENILLLVGEPGLGKSKMSTMALKHAMHNTDKLPYDKQKDNPTLENQFISVAYVKSIDVLANDGFWRTLERKAPDFCIIDDLDYMLTKRNAEVQSIDDATKNSFLNQFLSFTDGVEKHMTKFIITTNQKYDEIDSALLRKGRLFDILELRHLNNNEARDIWLNNNLKEEDFSEVFTTDKVLPAELGSEISKRLNNRITTATMSYLKEENISKVKKAGRAKKIGL
jgi:DNA replication protein DnaC